jgi:mono/diheme cytochrome c family protein
MRVAVVLVVMAACGAPGAQPPSPPPVEDPRPAQPLMSDPAEYAIDRVSREAGERIFVRTGIGDPYKTGVPYPVWLALMDAFPARLGANSVELADKFGFIARAPDPASDDLDVREGLPFGMHLTIDPITTVPFVVNACALCHAERIGEQIVVGLGSKRARIHAYDAAFGALVGDDGFELMNLVALADDAAARRDIPWPDEYSLALVKASVTALRTRAEQRAELHARTQDGPPGLVAPIEAFATALEIHRGEEVAFADTVGWSKIPDVIGFARRTTLSWDGLGEGPMDVLVVEADFAAGVRPEWFWAHPLQGASLSAYLRAPEPRPPYPEPLDAALVARGKARFEDTCADCHGTYADDGRALDYEERVIPLDELGTDPARAHAATESFLAAANDPQLTKGITRARLTGGYVPPVLTNVWARAPYGHAGQWASLEVMATPPDHRPAAPAGISALGHPFLADLGAEDAAAVIAYLRSL